MIDQNTGRANVKLQGALQRSVDVIAWGKLQARLKRSAGSRPTLVGSHPLTTRFCGVELIHVTLVIAVCHKKACGYTLRIRTLFFVGFTIVGDEDVKRETRCVNFRLAVHASRFTL